MDNKKPIVLSQEKDLRIYMMPLRQKIIRTMRVEGRPVTAKYIADKLGISPSSASHHIKQLQQIGIVEFDHTEVINGITASYLRVTDRTIRLGTGINDELSDDRDVMTRNMIYDMYDGLSKATDTVRSMEEPLDEEEAFLMAEMLSGVMHLTTNEMKEVYSIINKYLSEHEKAADDTHPYSYMLMAYRNDLP